MGESVVVAQSPVAGNPNHAERSYRLREIHAADRIFYYGLKILAWAIVLVLLSMIVTVGVMAWPAIKHFGLYFFVSQEWNSYTNEFGALAFIYGTLITSFIAVVVAVPVAVGVALFLSELAPRWMATGLGFFVEMLAAIPSIVYGLWGLFVLAPWLREELQPFLSEWFGFLPIFQGPPLGVGILAAGLILAIMITPTIAAISREVFRSIPLSYREAALGLGATRWETIRWAVLRSGVSGIVGAIMLGLGRAMGETMAVTMVIGNRPEIRWSWFDSGQTMASLLANQYAEAESDLHLAALTAVGLALFIISLIVNALARFIVSRTRR